MVFKGNENTIVAFSEEGIWYGTGENEVILLEIIDYSEGVITMTKEGVLYRFVVIDNDVMYDENTKNLLVRRAYDG